MSYNQNMEYLEEIDLYLNGSLSDTEMEVFEERLKSDPQLAYEVERHKIARSIIKSASLREKLDFLGRDEFTSKKQGILNKYSIVVKILAVIVLFGLTVFVFELFTLNNDVLFENQYSVYQLNLSGDKPPSHSSVLYSFTSQNYQDVINIYENKSLESNEDTFLSGISYLELNRAEKAIENFLKILTQAQKGGENDYFGDAEYYTGLAYLKINQIDAAYWYFSKIYHDNSHPYNEQVNQWFYWKLRIVKIRKMIF
ncbi:MAG TPA: tetratricopeptide repeat protein [Cytophagales bacterium]|nr:tetratricopeptide repeat protein [Cytophagales bacterium]